MLRAGFPTLGTLDDSEKNRRHSDNIRDLTCALAVYDAGASLIYPFDVISRTFSCDRV